MGFATGRKRDVLTGVWDFRKICRQNPCERPTSFPRAPNPGSSAARRIQRGRSSIPAPATPRTTPRAQAEVASGDCRQPSGRDQPDEAPARVDRLDRAPAAILGIAPLIVTAWVGDVFVRVLELTGIGAALVLLGVTLAGWFGWRPLFRAAEKNFWALNALGVQPGYALCREAIRHLAERALTPSGGAELARMRGLSCAGAGMMLVVVATLVAYAVWPWTRWIGSGQDLAAPHQLIVPTLANAIVIMTAYLAAASLVWGFADASMDQPLDLEAFDAPPAGGRVWRVAHLSDIHIVGERYGFRIESGRGGPRGNERLKQAMARLEAEHAARPLDLVLITGDMTDAGRSSEWAEFFDIVARPSRSREPDARPARKSRRQCRRSLKPGAARPAVQPGEDLAQDARFVRDRSLWRRSPAGHARRRRRARPDPCCGACASASGDRDFRRPKRAQAVEPSRTPLGRIVPARSTAGRRQRAWRHPSQFERGYEFLVHQCAGNDTGRPGRRLTAALDHYPKARWIVALHHHLIEYPMPVAAFSERIGTALINGSWFERVLKPYAGRSSSCTATVTSTGSAPVASSGSSPPPRR